MTAEIGSDMVGYHLTRLGVNADVLQLQISLDKIRQLIVPQFLALENDSHNLSQPYCFLAGINFPVFMTPHQDG